jgi:hypothetical protein
MGWEAVEGRLTGGGVFGNGGGAQERGVRGGGCRGGVRVAGCSGTFYRAEGRSEGGRSLEGRRQCSGAPL